MHVVSNFLLKKVPVLLSNWKVIAIHYTEHQSDNIFLNEKPQFRSISAERTMEYTLSFSVVFLLMVSEKNSWFVIECVSQKMCCQVLSVFFAAIDWQASEKLKKQKEDFLKSELQSHKQYIKLANWQFPPDAGGKQTQVDSKCICGCSAKKKPDQKSHRGKHSQGKYSVAVATELRLGQTASSSVCLQKKLKYTKNTSPHFLFIVESQMLSETEKHNFSINQTNELPNCYLVIQSLSDLSGKFPDWISHYTSLIYMLRICIGYSTTSEYTLWSNNHPITSFGKCQRQTSAIHVGKMLS